MTPKQLFLSHQAQTTHFPLMMEMDKAEGNYLYDKAGKAYLDLISGISVSHLGHGNQHVKEAIKAQVDKHMHLMVYGEFVQNPQVMLCAELAKLLPENLNCTYLVNSGAEATDGALKLAKRVTGRAQILACKNAYHGSTHGALSVMGDEFFKNSFRPLLPDVKILELNNTKYLGLKRENIDLLKETSSLKLKKIIKKNDIILFIAAIAPAKNSHDLIKNLIILKNVCNNIDYKKIRKIIYISSDAVYSDTKKKISEKSETIPTSIHGTMHLVRENYLRNIYNKKLCIVRPTLIYGSNDPHNSYGPNSFIRKYLNNEKC